MHPEERWRQRLIDAEQDKSWLVFAERDGALIGMSGAYQWPEDRAANRAMIIAVFVDESARGLGIGEMLMQAVMDEMAAAGLRARSWRSTRSRLPRSGFTRRWASASPELKSTPWAVARNAKRPHGAPVQIVGRAESPWGPDAERLGSESRRSESQRRTMTIVRPRARHHATRCGQG